MFVGSDRGKSGKAKSLQVQIQFFEMEKGIKKCVSVGWGLLFVFKTYLASARNRGSSASVSVNRIESASCYNPAETVLNWNFGKHWAGHLVRICLSLWRMVKRIFAICLY